MNHELFMAAATTTLSSSRGLLHEPGTKPSLEEKWWNESVRCFLAIFRKL
jgi:hypothetical protein